MDLSRVFARSHTAIYDSPAVYYTFAFSLPEKTDIHKLADKLLKLDLATTATLAGSSAIRYSHRFQSLTENRALAVSLGTLDAVVKGDKSFTSWALRNRRAASFLIRNRLVRFSLRASPKATPDADLLKTIEDLGQIPQDLDTSVIDTAKMIASHAAMDDTLFQPGYLLGEPFIRLELGSLYIDSEQLGDHELVLLLLLHRSGVGLLTFAGIPGAGRTTEDLLSVSASKSVAFEKIIYTESTGRVVRPNPDAVVTDKWDTSDDGLLRWREIVWKEPINLQELFLSYAAIIGQVWGAESEDGDFLCYTTLFIDHLQCCSSRKQWLWRHSRELAGLIMREPRYLTLKKAVVKAEIANDHDHREARSRFLHFGSGVIIRWEFAESDGTSPADHASVINVVENVLLQYWQLRRLDRRLALHPRRLRDLADLQHELVSGLEEYRRSQLMWVGAQAIVRHIATESELDRLYSRIVERLDVIQQLISTRAAEVASRRSFLITALGVSAAVLLGVPAIEGILTVVSGLDTSRFPGILAAPLGPFARADAAGVWSLYLVTISIFVLIAALSIATMQTRRRMARRVGRSFGIPWESVHFRFGAQRAEDHETE